MCLRDIAGFFRTRTDAYCAMRRGLACLSAGRIVRCSAGARYRGMARRVRSCSPPSRLADVHSTLHSYRARIGHQAPSTHRGAWQGEHEERSTALSWSVLDITPLSTRKGPGDRQTHAHAFLVARRVIQCARRARQRCEQANANLLTRMNTTLCAFSTSIEVTEITRECRGIVGQWIHLPSRRAACVRDREGLRRDAAHRSESRGAVVRGQRIRAFLGKPDLVAVPRCAANCRPRGARAPFASTRGPSARPSTFPRPD